MRKSIEAIHRFFTTAVLISFGLGVLFFVTNNLDFLINAITFGRANFPNMMYWLTKFLSTLIIPIIFVLPTFGRFERIKLAKYSFIAYGVLHIISLSWIFMYIGENGFGGLFSNEAITAFQQNTFVYSYVYWDTYSWIGNIYAVLYGAFCIYVGLSFDDEKSFVCKLVTLSVVLRVLLPILSNLFTGHGLLSNFWITNNCVDVLGLAVFALAVNKASTFDATWISLIWDHEIPQSEEE